MTAWTAELDAARDRFIEALEQRGLVPRDATTLTGNVATATGEQPVRVSLPDNFPYRPPRVVPDDNFPRSWHRERDGAMCLYGDDSDEELPWLDADDFLAMVTRWFDESAAGWPGDLPVLDLDRYFTPSTDTHLVLYGDLTDLTYVKFKDSAATRIVDGPATASRRRNRTSKVNGQRVIGYVADIGEPDVPPTNWAEVAALLDSDTARTLTSAIESGQVRYVLLKYRRGGHDALLTLQVQPDKEGTVVARSLKSASIAPNDLNLRAGTQRSELQDKHVLVIGAGALGSHICDTLARAGVGHLTVRDHGTIEPGNLVRHLAAERHIGWNKADAVADVIESRSFNTTDVRPDTSHLRNPLEVPDLLGTFDLVVDATANGTVTGMLAKVAKVQGYRFVSACLQENGTIVRVDVIPPVAGDALAATVPSPEGTVEVGYQTGCGDPISLTPHLAVIEAAALAARHAVGLLTDAPVTDAGVVNDYR